MSEWQQVTLQNVTLKIGDGLHGTPKYDNNGNYYFINGNNLKNGKIVIRPDTKRTTKAEYEKHGKGLTDKTLLLSINGTLGNIGIYNNEKCILGKSACYLNVAPEIDFDFVKYTLTNKQFQDYISIFAHGTTIKNVALQTIREYSFLLPPLPEQKAIASVLSSLDDKIDLLHRQNKTLEAMAETLFRQWFVEEADASWEEGSILDLIKIIGGGTPKTSEVAYWDGEFPWISGGDISSNHKAFISSTQKFISADGLRNSATKLLPKFATVISARGTVGKYSILSKPMTFSQSNYGILPEYKNCYFFVYLLINHVVHELKSAAYGSVFDTITIATFADFRIRKPSLLDTQAFEKKVSSLFLKQMENTFQIQTLEKLRDTLLPKLMSGEVRVKT